MFSDMAVDLKSKIECRGLLRKIDGLPLRSENHDVIIIERSDYILNETTLLLMELHILQDIAEAIHPSAYIALLALSDNPDGVVANHTLRGDVNPLMRSEASTVWAASTASAVVR